MTMVMTPDYKRMMIFVDGTNFLRELSKELEIAFRADKPPVESLAIANSMTGHFFDAYGVVKIRKYWFSSYQGNEEYHDQLAKQLRSNDFEPVLFKKKEDREREKGVDIALAKEMLVNSFNQNFDIGVLIAGDEDYVGLVTEVKRYGPIVWGSFFSHGLSEKLRIVFDRFIDIVEYNHHYLNSQEYKNCVEAIRSSYSPR